MEDYLSTIAESLSKFGGLEWQVLSTNKLQIEIIPLSSTMNKYQSSNVLVWRNSGFKSLNFSGSCLINDINEAIDKVISLKQEYAELSKDFVWEPSSDDY